MRTFFIFQRIFLYTKELKMNIIPAENCNLIDVNNRNVSFLLTLNRFHTFFFLLFIQVNARSGWFLLQQFCCVSYIYLHVQQKQLSSYTNLSGTGGAAEGKGSNNSTGMILLYDFYQSWLGNNNLRGFENRGIARIFLKEGIKCLKMSVRIVGPRKKLLGFGPTKTIKFEALSVISHVRCFHMFSST